MDDELLQLLLQYLEQITRSPEWYDLFISIWLPIISGSVLVLSAGAGIYKYYTSKNRELYEMLLSEVYAPLYGYFVKQELFSHFHSPNRNYKESPILELTSVKTTTRTNSEGTETKREVTSPLNINRDEFMKIKDSINLGLSTQELFTLLSMYEVLIYMETKYDKFSDEWAKASIMKVDIERAIRDEIFTGYEKIYKKLGLESNTKSKYWMVNKDQIYFDYELQEDEMNKLKAKVANNPELYTKSRSK